MKKIIVLCWLLSLIISCKKKDNNDMNTSSSAQGPGIFNAFFESQYGNCFTYNNIGNNPLTILSNGNLIVTSNQYDGVHDKIQVTKTNSSGNIIWQNIFTNGYDFKAEYSFEDNSGNIIVLGANQYTWMYSKTFIAKLNPVTGDTIWTKSYGYNNQDKALMGYQDSNNNYWLVDIQGLFGPTTLFKISQNGDSLSSIINSESNSIFYHDALITNDKKIILVGESGSSVFIGKYTDGIKDFSSFILIDSTYKVNYVKDICETSDGNYVISGSCYIPNNSSLTYGFLMKVDINGNKIWKRVLNQIPYSEIQSCVERQSDVFYIGLSEDPNGYGNLYKYDLSTLTFIYKTYQSSDVQLLIKNSILYRASLDSKPNYYEAVTVMAHSIY